jgi:type I restriction enzyme S subunit
MRKEKCPTVALGDLVEPAKTWNPAKSPSDETFTYIDLSAVDQDAKVINAAREVSCGEAPSRARQLVTAGDVLVSTVRPNLNGVARVPAQLDGATASTGFCVLRAREPQLDARYLFQWVKSSEFIDDMVRKATGASYPAVSDRIIFESAIPLPPLAEQRRIAEVLDRAEALRAKRRAALAELDALTQSLFLDLFGDPVTNPKGWPESGIEDVCELIVDCVNRTAPIVDGPTPFKMIRTTNVKAGKVNLAEVRYVTEETFKQWNRRTTPKRGDVLLTREAPVGEAGMLESDDSVFLGQRLMLYRTNRERMQPEYLLAAFRGSFLQQQFDRHGSGSTVKHLPLPACRSFQVHVPPIALQQEFARRVGAVEKLKAAQRTALAEQDALFATLQHRAFRGEL